MIIPSPIHRPEPREGLISALPDSRRGQLVHGCYNQRDDGDPVQEEHSPPPAFLELADAGERGCRPSENNPSLGHKVAVAAGGVRARHVFATVAQELSIVDRAAVEIL